jgi:threonylcarbamoyladenosine tRNA methylthiotransferase MtaB
MARVNPAARLVVTGCYATLEGETTAQLPNVELVVGNDRKDELLALIRERDERAPATIISPIAHADRAASRTRAFIKVQDGCRNHCTFCIVTVARGAERSRPIADLVREINALHADVYQEAVLTGVHLGGYGSDLDTDLHALVAALLESTTIPRLRLSSLEPFDLSPDFFALWQQSGGRLMPHLHLPAQSGSDAVLKRMARRNRVANFEALAASAREQIPGLAITTDIIAGFPGETQAMFDETVAFARRMNFSHMHLFPYSARAGTAAAHFPGQVPEAERKRRVRLLAGLDAEMGDMVRRSFIGQVRPVLWESRMMERETHGQATWSGLTDNYLRVLTTTDESEDLHNRITPVLLTGVDGNDLCGSIVED